MPAASRAETGIVSSQATASSPATVQRTFDTRSAEPVPMIDELTTWVVRTGPPSSAAPRITLAVDGCGHRHAKQEGTCHRRASETCLGGFGPGA